MGNYAVLLNAGPKDAGPATNALRYAATLAAASHDVAVYFDGAATAWPKELVSRLDHPMRTYFDELLELDATVGACALCASAYETTESCKQAGVELLGSTDEHAPDVSLLIEDGYELLPVG
ncbi:DsrE family protein [Salinigranum halophilum]|uniref:DsrE family protein n=1 Tax=Salinigranum halophilum TaxID=2565931 RepID=UPI0013757F3C|nr:DsrE family protein [Salinigranum halophilum]